MNTGKGKANAFASHYANVSKHTFSKEERDINRELRKRISTSKKENDKVPDFTMHKLKKAIMNMKKKGADISPIFLKNLGETSPN